MNAQELLDGLAKAGGPGGWVCRGSTTGRGLRLHQASCEEAQNFGLTLYADPAKAIEAFLADLRCDRLVDCIRKA